MMNRQRRRVALIAALMALAMANASAQARTSISRSPQLLPAEEAFAAWARMSEPAMLKVEFLVAPGYYLYKDKLAFGIDSSQLQLGAPHLPEGESIVDEFFGVTEVYRGAVEISLPLTASGIAPNSFKLRLLSQGCSESPAVCYPPLLRHLPVEFPAENTAKMTLAAGFLQPIQTRLTQAGGTLTILLFFALGMTLAFTPCSLPMLPVLSSLIVRRRTRGETRASARNEALLRSIIYVLSMSLTYAAAGVLSAWLGVSLQQYFQSPWVRGFTAALLVALAVVMFDLWQLASAGGLRRRLEAAIDKLQGGGTLQLAAWGALSALVLSPCISPPLVAALLYISNTGDVALGGIALFMLGLGMGTPLIALGASLGIAIPKAGAWMLIIKRGLGFALLGVALWLLGGILSSRLLMLGLALILAGAGLWLWIGIAKTRLDGILARTAGLALAATLLFAAMTTLVVGDVWRVTRDTTPAIGKSVAFEAVESWVELQEIMVTETKPIMLEIYADWCIACREMEARTYSDARVAAVLHRDFRALRADVGPNENRHRELLRQLGLFGPPASLFFLNGRELENLRLIGTEPADHFGGRLRTVLK